MATKSGKDVKANLKIAPPLPSKVPLKTNIYEHAQAATGSLTPLFPYRDAGSMVPCTTLFWGRKREGDYGFFMHDNSVDEISILFGGDGTTGRGNTGLVRCAENRHGVGKLLRDCEDPENFSLVAITQRQAENRTQNEAVWFICENCKGELARVDFNPVIPEQGKQDDLGKFLPLETLIFGAEVSERLNESEESRTCKKCGHVNAPFPLERWGWDKYTGQTRAAQNARKALEQAAKVSGHAEAAE